MGRLLASVGRLLASVATRSTTRLAIFVRCLAKSACCCWCCCILGGLAGVDVCVRFQSAMIHLLLGGMLLAHSAGVVVIIEILEWTLYHRAMSCSLLVWQLLGSNQEEGGKCFI